MAKRIGNPRYLLNMIKKQYGEDADPIAQMAAIANDPNESTRMRFDSLKELAGYIYPKLKASEVTVDDKRAPKFNMTVEVQPDDVSKLKVVK